jgi:hypothetical protein
MRSIFNQVEGPPKTLASRRPVPMSSELASTLNGWSVQTSYSKPEDYVFASPLAVGKLPYWPNAVLKTPCPIGGREGKNHQTDSLAYFPPYTGDPVAVLWDIGKNDAGNSCGTPLPVSRWASILRPPQQTNATRRTPLQLSSWTTPTIVQTQQ